MRTAITTLALLILAATTGFAVEGKWTPQQMLELDPAWLRRQGLTLPPSTLWDPAKGTGLLAGTVNVGGCSGGFISAEGLLITNHHCLFSILQEHATPQKDIITNGYLARTRSAELPGKSIRVTVPRRFTDVTKDVLGAIPKDAGDADRHRAIERKQSELVAECEKQPATRCRVAAFDGGVYYTLIDALELSDVRLVYAPPRAVGEFGGEVDNWMWPRHTGDFAIARAYVAPDGAAATFDAKNVPYRAQHFFPISTAGISDKEFVMVLGYPGTTYRALTANEMTERRDLFFTRRSEVYGEWIRILEETTKGHPEGAIAVADNLKTLENRRKNADGQLAGFRRWSVVEKQREKDQAVEAFAAKNENHRGGTAAYKDLAALVEEQRRTWDHDFLLAHAHATATTPSPLGPKALIFATTVARAAIEKQKPDAQRDALYQERNVRRVRERLEREQKNFFAPSDKAMLASVVRRAVNLPKEQRIEAIDRLFAGATDDAAIARRIDEIYAATRLFDLPERMKMFDETPEQLRARKDPLVDLGFALDRDIREYAERKDRWDGAISRLRPAWRRAVMAHAGKPIAPDANSTLRVSFAHVSGYQPRDGVFYTPQTSLSGVVEKHTGKEPFDVPAGILKAAQEKRFGKWQDKNIKDVPVNFLADGDTTGGNSGSPTINGKGQLVGVNFDRVWENVSNDFGYLPEVGRNINVDIRYLMWILDEVEHASELLRELGVK